MKRPRIRLSAFKQGGSPPSFAGAMAALEPSCVKIPRTSRTPGPEARGGVPFGSPSTLLRLRSGTTLRERGCSGNEGRPLQEGGHGGIYELPCSELELWKEQ